MRVRERPWFLRSPTTSSRNQKLKQLFLSKLAHFERHFVSLKISLFRKRECYNFSFRQIWLLQKNSKAKFSNNPSLTFASLPSEPRAITIPLNHLHINRYPGGYPDSPAPRCSLEPRAIVPSFTFSTSVLFSFSWERSEQMKRTSLMFLVQPPQDSLCLPQGSSLSSESLAWKEYVRRNICHEKYAHKRCKNPSPPTTRAQEKNVFFTGNFSHTFQKKRQYTDVIHLVCDHYWANKPTRGVSRRPTVFLAKKLPKYILKQPNYVVLGDP